MALDHFVSQVYLRHWCLPDTSRLLAFRKSDGKTFEPKTQDVCRIEDGNTNSYLKDDRLIEDFLSFIEPKYNAALEGIVRKEIPHEAVFAIAGFASAVYVCSPTAMRILVPQAKSMLEATAFMADKHGMFGTPPPQLGGSSMTELLQTGKVVFKVDPKYPQAVSIGSIVDYVRIFGNSEWELLTNSHADSPFLTSDFPFALEGVSGPVQLRVVPLTPTLAVRIIPSFEARDKEKYDLRFPGFRFRRRSVTQGEAAHINRLIVRCAEDLVFCSGRLHWVEGFVQRNRGYRTDIQITSMPTSDKETIMLSRHCIAEHPKAEAKDASKG
jgi:hypothetical protein